MLTPKRPAGLLAVFLLAALAALGPAGTANAHGDTIRFRIAGAPDGHPRAVATWENDGDPVDEEVAATLSAVSDDGRSVGPWRLVPVQGSPASFRTREPLPVGRWKVTVESAFPALGRGEAELTVDVIQDPSPAATPAPTSPAAGAATPVRPGPTVPASAVPTTSASSLATVTTAAESPAEGSTVGRALATIAALVVGTAGVVALRARRRAAR
ncbi:hypothetical protein OG689_35155 [Kitasatospora sp. NBC_00240]|uniref:hypothetical protein n=1 Tax=Kitasatospora sp. NBC_00240 TaxID=2903567 RepID=UPI002252BCBB|nr:hypothetical protein [Kitasatospora sp. NBC_00240]MCX5214438.1 hypothetical protein [Kitasatospora sp. NBC_00240]